MLTAANAVPKILLAFLILLVSIAETSASSVYSYDASLGTLPEAQGFTRGETGSPPEPTVGGGILHQFPGLSGPDVQFWQNNSVPLDFTTTPYYLEADLHVISSNFVPPNREGYYLHVIDSAGRGFAVGISNDLIRLSADNNIDPGSDTVAAAFDPTGAFHTYRLVIDGGTGTLFIDGTVFLSMPIGTELRPDATNRVLFGDESGLGVSESELRSFEFGVVPEPATLSLGILSALFAAMMIRRHF